ncbi:hypothetical protein ACOMHN_044863 [Nucella lapillus]
MFGQVKSVAPKYDKQNTLKRMESTQCSSQKGQTMACIMRREVLAVCALLLTMGWSCTLPQDCDLTGLEAVQADRLAGLEAVQADRLAGRWYEYQLTCTLPGYSAMNGYAVDVSFTKTDENTTLNIISHMKFHDGTQICSSRQWNCSLSGASCQTSSLLFRHSFVIFSIDYDKYFAKWSRTYLESSVYDIVDIFVRDPNTAASVIADSHVLDKVQQRCGYHDFTFKILESGPLQSCT